MGSTDRCSWATDANLKLNYSHFDAFWKSKQKLPKLCTDITDPWDIVLRYTKLLKLDHTGLISSYCQWLTICARVLLMYLILGGDSNAHTHFILRQKVQICKRDDHHPWWPICFAQFHWTGERAVNTCKLYLSFLLFQLKKYLPHDCVVVNEGANTMDIGRTMIPNHLPRNRYASFFMAEITQFLHLDLLAYTSDQNCWKLFDFSWFLNQIWIKFYSCDMTLS